MSKKLFFDTNILVDAVIDSRPDHIYATLLFDEIRYGEVEGLVAGASLKDVYYIVSKYATEPQAREYVGMLLDAFRVLPVDGTICKRAARSDEPDFEDGIVRACAEVAGADFIISRDEGAFGRSYIKRLSAREYVDLFCEVHEVEL